jgi:hypothetical protein
MHHTFPGNCLIFAPLSYTGRRTTYSRAKEIFSGTVPPSSIPKCAIRNDVANEGQFFIICLQPDPALLFLLPGPIRGSHPIRTRFPPFFSLVVNKYPTHDFTLIPVLCYSMHSSSTIIPPIFHSLVHQTSSFTHPARDEVDSLRPLFFYRQSHSF